MGLGNKAIAEAEARETGRPARTAHAVAQDLRVALQGAKDDRESLSEYEGVLEAERLERLQQTVETLMRAENQRGQCQACGRSSDPDMVLKAANQLLRIAERRASLRGLDLKGKDAPPPAVEDELAKIRNRVQNEHPRQGGRRPGKV